MLIAGVLCLCAAAASALLGARALARPAPAGGAAHILRSVAPTQLAAAVMLAAGGVVALSATPSVGLLILCVAGAIGTVVAGVWQGARYADALRHRAASGSSPTCQGSGNQACIACTLSCR